MIVKSFLAEKNDQLLNEKITLFYGPNIGLKFEFKKKLFLIQKILT